MTLSARFRQALVYATEQHDGQHRKGSRTPYIAHPLAVASLVLEHGGDEEEAIAALLHDVVEDCGGLTRLAEIRILFGERVADIVRGCSDSVSEEKPPWRERKEAYLAHLRQASPQVLRVSCADKLHNARAILNDYRELGERLWKRFRGKREGTLWYYRALADAFGNGAPPRLAAELARTVDEIERLAAADHSADSC
jgi:(p)ppGpp synthase/HD superfamily hydrolase